MIYTPKKILNVFGGPGGVNTPGGRQIGPVAYIETTGPRSGGWVLNNNNSNCATNCANNCTNNVGSNRGFRRALSVSPNPRTKMKVLPNSAGLCNQKYGRYQGAKATESALVSALHRGMQPEYLPWGAPIGSTPRANETYGY